MSSTVHKAKKAKKVSTSLRPFGLTKTKSESNLDQPFELIHVDIDIDDQNQEKKKSKIIELTPVSKQTVPQVQVTLGQSKGPSKQSTNTALDEGLEEFFGDAKTNETPVESAAKVDITTEDLDAISSQTSQ